MRHKSIANILKNNGIITKYLNEIRYFIQNIIVYY
jgi:hypothetical protein